MVHKYFRVRFQVIVSGTLTMSIMYILFLTLSFNVFWSTPVLMHSGLICITFCPSVCPPMTWLQPVWTDRNVTFLSMRQWPYAYGPQTRISKIIHNWGTNMSYHRRCASHILLPYEKRWALSPPGKRVRNTSIIYAYLKVGSMSTSRCIFWL